MWPRSWLNRLRHGASRVRARRRPTTSPLLLEVLEDRTVPSFSSIASYPTGSYPQAVLAADFTGDSLADLAVVNYGDNSISVLKNLGGGSFDIALTSLTGSGPRSLAAGDLDHDGDLDLVTANSGGDVSVLLGNGDGTFQPPASLTLPGQFPPDYTDSTPLAQTPLSVAVGDIDGDGHLDLVATGQTAFTQSYTGYYGGTYYSTVYNGYVNVLLGNGSGSFSDGGTHLLYGASPDSIVLADFDGNGRTDVAAVDAWYSTVSVLLNIDGTLQDPVNSSTGYAPRSAAAGDLDGDGKLDLVTADSYGVSVLRGKGDGTFESLHSLSVNGYPLSVAVGDVNADGRLDLVVTSNQFTCTSYGYYGCYDGYYTGSVNVVLGYGDGTFASPEATTLPNGSPVAVALTDLDGNGSPDAAVADSGAGQVSVLRNASDWVLPPSLRISDVTVTEGDSGTVNAVFTVRLLAGGNQTVTVHYSTADGTAIAGKDYVATSGTLTFAPGDTTQTITVLVKGDLTDEYDESFSVTLSNATNANIDDPYATGTILDNDPPPTLSINDVSIREGGRKSTKVMVFTVTLSAPSEKWVYVNFATADGTATTADNDYRATSGTLAFAPGQTTATISVVVVGDSKQEPDETFYVNLSGAVNAGIDDAQGLGTILDDDTPPGHGKKK